MEINNKTTDNGVTQQPILKQEVERMKARDERKAREQVKNQSTVNKPAVKCFIHLKQEREIIILPNGKQMSSCPICRADWAEHEKKEKAEQEQKAKEERRKREETERQQRVAQACIPERFRDAVLETVYQRNEKERGIVETVKKMLDDFYGHPGLLFRGNNGAGKTYLACAVANEALKQGKTALYTRLLHIFYTLRDAQKNNNLMETNRIYTRPDILIIDELGVQHDTPFEVMALSDIFDCRYAAMKPTVIMGNVAEVEQVQKLLGKRIIDRYKHGGTDLLFDWESRRK